MAEMRALSARFADALARTSKPRASDTDDSGEVDPSALIGTTVELYPADVRPPASDDTPDA